MASKHRVGEANLYGLLPADVKETLINGTLRRAMPPLGITRTFVESILDSLHHGNCALPPIRPSADAHRGNRDAECTGQLGEGAGRDAAGMASIEPADGLLSTL